MSELVPTGSKYTDAQRLNALRQYAIDGVFTKTSEITGIPERTLNDWGKSDWWAEELAKVRAEIQDQHISRYHELTSQSLDLALDGLKSLQGKELKSSDIKALVVTGATATDKARLLLNQPTSIRGDSDSIKSLTQQFQKLAQDHQNIQNSVVSVQDAEQQE